MTASRKQSGQMIQRKPNVWLLRVYHGLNAQGKKVYVSKTIHGTTSQARQALTEMLRDQDTHQLVPRARQTLSEYVDLWLTSKLSISPKTTRSYQDQLARVKTLIGSSLLTDLSAQHARQVVASMVAEGLSPRSVRYTARLLKQVLDQAEEDRLIARNPIGRLELPPESRKAPQILTPTQMQALLTKAKDSPWEPLWRLLLTTGMRTQEALGLAWEHVDLVDGWLSIQQALVNDGKGHYSVSERVKADSRRRIALPSSTVESLKRHRKAQAELIISRGADYNRTLHLVFANREGKPLDISKVRRAWKAALTLSALVEIPLYNTRHSHLSALIAAGAGLAEVAQRAGHADVNTTTRRYIQVMPESQQKVGRMIEDMLQRVAV